VESFLKAITEGVITDGVKTLFLFNYRGRLIHSLLFLTRRRVWMDEGFPIGTYCAFVYCGGRLWRWCADYPLLDFATADLNFLVGPRQKMR